MRCTALQDGSQIPREGSWRKLRPHHPLNYPILDKTTLRPSSPADVTITHFSGNTIQHKKSIPYAKRSTCVLRFFQVEAMQESLGLVRRRTFEEKPNYMLILLQLQQAAAQYYFTTSQVRAGEVCVAFMCLSQEFGRANP